MSKQYRTCPYCGAHLDCGEICDCRASVAAHSDDERQERREAAGRAERNRTEPALMAAV